MTTAPNNLYRGSFYPCYHTEDGMRETSQDLVFLADSEQAAYEDFCRYTIRCFTTYNNLATDEHWLYVGCIKVSPFQFYRVNQDGYTDPVRNGLASIFVCMEWKCDTGLYNPKNPSAELRHLIDQVKALTLKP